MNTSIKKIADLENVLGKTIARNFLAYLTAGRASYSGQKLKRVPYSVKFHAVKPSMYLGDYDTLTAYLINLETGLVESEHYCGSFDTAINHAEQGATGSVSKGYAVFMVTVHGGGDRLAWSIDAVSSDLVKQIAVAA